MSMDMDEIDIARSMAEILNSLTNSGDSKSPGNGHVLDRRWRQSVKLSSEELQLARLEGITAQLAMSRANAKAQDFRDVLRETQFEVSVQLARILADTIDPVLERWREVVIEEEGHVCGVCQDEMEVGDEARAMAGCMHKFHAYCIFKWLKQTNSCPLCRYRM